VLLTVLSWGTHLTVLGADLGVRLPWQLLVDVALVGQAEPVRLQVFVALCVAAGRDVARPPASRGRRRWRWPPPAPPPRWRPGSRPTPRTSCPPTSRRSFRTAATELAPYDVVRPSADQRHLGRRRRAAALAGHRRHGLPDHRRLLHRLGPRALPAAGNPQNAYDTVANAVAAGTGPPPEAAAKALHDLRAEGVTAVVVVDRAGLDSAAVTAWTQQVTGTPGLRTGGVWLFHLP